MNKYIKNYILYIVNNSLSLVFPIITFPYISRVLGPSKLGMVNFVQAYGYYFIHLASFGINSYGIRELSKVRNNSAKSDIIANEIFNLNLFFSILSTILYFVIVFSVKKFFENILLFCIYSIVILTDFASLVWILQSFDDYKFTAIRDFIVKIISVVLIFLLVKNENDYPIYMLAITLTDMGARIFNIFYIKNHYLKLRVNKKFLNFKKHIKSMFTLFFFRFVNGVSSYLDKLMIGFMITYASVGIYTAGVKFPLLLAPIVEAIGIVVFPKINISANDNCNEYFNNLKMNYDAILMLAIPMFVGFFLVSPKIILLFAGKNYYDSIIISRIMSLIIVLCPLGDMIGSKILLINNKDKELLICSFIVAFSNLILNLIFIPLYGNIGAAIASIFSYIVSIISRYYFAYNIVRFNLFSLRFLKYVLFTVPFIVLYLFFKDLINYSIFSILIFVFISILIYIIELGFSKDYLFKIIISKIPYVKNVI